MPNYPPERESTHNSDDDEEDEEEEEAEEELVEWTELTSMAELAALEDGPSTFIVGGFSPCQHLGEAVDHVKYKEDVVVVFPGVYATARATASSPSAAPATAGVVPALELNEAALGGLRIFGVAHARAHVTAEGDGAAVAVPKYAAPSKRRVGPWFTWLTAAATAALLTQEGGGGDDAAGATAQEKNLLKAAAIRAAAATDTHAAVVTTTSGSSVFASTITTTTANAAVFPVFDFPISFVYADSSDGATGGLPHYIQEKGDEDAMEEKGEGEDDDGDVDTNERNNIEDDEDGAGTGRPAGRVAKNTPQGSERAITLAGCCARAGLTFGALTRTAVVHCVVGTPQSPSPLRIAVTAASLTEAVVDHCLVYGGTAYGVYAFPRAALSLRSTLIEGANAAAERTCGSSAVSASATAAAASMGSAQGTSVIAQLEHRRARALRLRGVLHGGDDMDGNGNGEDGGSSGGSAYVDVENGVLPRFVTPQMGPTCEVGVMCDDADVHLEDCLVSHARLGVLLHDGCAGTTIRGLDIRSCAEVGLYVYGIAGAAEVLNSTVRACGRACLLLVGPSLSEMTQAAAALGLHGSDNDDAESGDGGDGARRLVLAQHPYLKSNTFIGAVRVQGEVRSGAVVDNFVFLPKEEKSAATTATAAQTLLAVDAAARRGFTYVGVEGERVTGRAADQATTAR